MDLTLKARVAVKQLDLNGFREIVKKDHWVTDEEIREKNIVRKEAFEMQIATEITLLRQASQHASVVRLLDAIVTSAGPTEVCFSSWLSE